MKRLRIGNDISVTWNVKKNGQPVDLSGKTVLLYMTHAKGREEIKAYSVSGSTLSFTIEGLEQKVLGRYTLTIDVRTGDEGKARYMIQDKCGAFELVGRSCVEEPEETEYTIAL